MPNPAPPSRRLQRRIAAGELRADRAQLAAARELDQLHRALAGRGRGGNWRAQLDRIKRAIHRGPRQNQTQGVYLWGGVGSGKTMLMDAFHAALPAGLSRRIHFHRFMQSAHDARAKLRDRQDPLTVIAAQWAARHRVLCLDEFSVTDITDAMLLSGLLRGLFDAGVTVLATSNTRPDDLYRGGLQRQRFLPAIALIQARMRVLRVDGGHDYRLDCLAAGALYHTPHDQHAMRAMRRSFARLEGGGGGGDGAGDSGEHGDGAGDGDSGDYGDGAGVLGDINGDGTGNGAGDTVAGETHFQLCGRAVDAVAIGRGVAWFRFDQLCGDARSKTDYIELARRFHTLLLSDIPRLDADADDAARRFIELVDELYDRGVNLIASAAAPPADLYRGRRLRAPFARAASRLREMNSRDYLARPHAQTARGRRKR